MVATGYTKGDPSKLDRAGDTMTGPLILDDASTAASKAQLGVTELRARSYSRRAAPIFCLLTKSAPQDIPNDTGALTTVSWDTEQADSEDIHSTIISNSRINPAPSQRGLWQLKACVEFASNATGWRRIAIVKNGSTIIGQRTVQAVSGTATQVAIDIETVVEDDVNYYEVAVRQNSGGLLAITTSSTFFCGRRIGDRVGPGGNVRFDGNWKYKGLSLYPTPGQFHPERISVVDDPALGPARQVLRFDVHDGDTGPTQYYRAQIQSPGDLVDGDDIYVGWSIYLPTDFPVIDTAAGDWLVFHEIYGQPFAGTGPLVMWVKDEMLRWQRGPEFTNDIPWQIPIQRGKWIDFVERVKLSANPAVGFVQLWVNTGSGLVAQPLGPSQVTQFFTNTLSTANATGPQFSSLKLSRSELVAHGVVTLYHGFHKLGTSQAAVNPRTYGG